MTRRLVLRLRLVLDTTRPVDPETAAVLRERWQALPAHVRTLLAGRRCQVDVV